jgi:hypothetical protein
MDDKYYRIIMLLFAASAIFKIGILLGRLWGA